METNEEKALRKVFRANIKMFLAMGALVWASLDASKAMTQLQEVLDRVERKDFPTPDQASEIKKAVEEMVATYAQSVN